MAIVSGVNIPDNKRVEIALRSIFGIGPTQAKDVVETAGITRECETSANQILREFAKLLTARRWSKEI